MSIENFRHLTGQTETIVDLLAMPGPVEVDADQARSDAWDQRAAFG